MGMNPRWKQPWIDALESGEYVQTQQVLHDGTGYCCLGVLCRVAGAAFQLMPNNELTYEPTYVDDIKLNDGNTLSLGAIHMFGLDENQQSTLIGLNDGVIGPIHEKDGLRLPEQPSKTFKEIAAYIKENL